MFFQHWMKLLTGKIVILDTFEDYVVGCNNNFWQQPRQSSQSYIYLIIKININNISITLDKHEWNQTRTTI